MHAGRIVLHLNSVIWHYSATRFSDMQSGIKELDNKYFGSSQLFLIFFTSCIHVQNKSYWSQEYLSSPISWSSMVSVKQSVNDWVKLKETISGLRLNFQSWEIMGWANSISVHGMEVWGFLWPSLVGRRLVSRIFFFLMCCDAFLALQIGFHTLHSVHWIFLCSGFVETWQRSRPSGPESNDCEMESESISTFWANIFNSR